MPFKEQPLDVTYQPPSYPAVDWESGRGLVKYAPTIGYLVLSEESLVWVPTAAPATPEAGLSTYISEQIQAYAAGKMTAQRAWEELEPYLPGLPAAEMQLSDVIDNAYGG